MAIKNNLSHLPTPTKSGSTAMPPDTDPRFVQVLAEGWAELDGGPKPRAFEDTRFRHSDAGKCARAIAYAALDVPDTDPMDLSGFWATGLGTIVHEAWQTQLQRRYPDAEIEPKVRVGQGSGHIDAVIRHDNGPTVAVELKTVGGFAYKMAVGERGAPKGPKHEHIVQAALNGLAVDADEVVIAYLSKESISVNAAARKGIGELARFCAEWTITREVFEPIATAELARVDGILALLDEDTLPARKIPDPELPTGAVITDPATGQWRQYGAEGEVLDAGSWWACGYCRWQTVCAGTEPGGSPVAQVAKVEIGGAA
jgi:hypothetical protein